ncbi:MAG: hypothetical protein ACXVEF_37015 [Polyangiales bacterium]
MTKAMRWGVSALLILGGVGFGSFVGCSSDDNPAPAETDTGTGEDTAVTTDTSTPEDTGTMEETAADTGPTDTGGETGPKPADRSVSLLFGSPDLGSKFACFGAFTADPATNDPFQALGPIGIPTTADKDPTKFAAIPYGAVIPLPLDATAAAALNGLTTVIYLTDTNPLTASPATTCAKIWKDVRGDAKAWKSFPAMTIKKGEQALVAITGCKGTSTTGECGAGTNLDFRIDKLSTTPAATFAGATTGPKTSIQFVHYSQYAGLPVTGTPPTYQGIDVYIQLFKSMGVTLDAGTDDSGDATTADGGTTLVPNGAPVKIADNVKYGDLGTVTGVQAGDLPNESYLVILPHGATYCMVGATCPATPIPLKKFLASYAAVGGGFIDGQNQFFALTGGPIPTATTDAGAPDPASAKIRVPMGRSFDPTK